MRIGIDARMYGPQRTGIGRYVERLVTNLESLDKKNDYFIFLGRENFDFYHPKNPNFHKVLATPRWYTLKEQLFLPGIFSKEKLNILHVPHFNVPIFYPGRIVVTVHDLIKHVWNPDSVTSHSLPVYAIKYVAYRLVIKEALKKASAVLTPSKYVKDKVVEMYKVNPEKITVTYEAGVLDKEEQIRSKKERAVENVWDRFGISSPYHAEGGRRFSSEARGSYFLYVGNVYPHKNVGRLLEAIKILNEKLGKQSHLVLAGARDDDSVFRKRLERQILEKDVLKYVTLTGYVSDPDLVDLYRGAAAYVQPSLSEGFGLTSVEAMALGTPVVEANASCLPEVAGEAALYFDPYDPSDIADKLGKILSDQGLRTRLARKGLEQAKTFSWEKLARRTLKVYESTAS